MAIYGTLMRATLAIALTSTSAIVAPSSAYAQAAFTAPDQDFEGQVRFSGPDGRPIYAGGEAVVTGRGFRPGQRVTLHYGQTLLTPSNGALVANGEGQFEGRISVPAGAATGAHAIVVLVDAPYHAVVAELRVAPAIPLAGADRFRIQSAPLTAGLYQSAYSARNNALFVTSAVGRPPVRRSELLRVNPDTLAIVARVTPAAAPNRERPGPDGSVDGGVYAVYGVAVDDAHDNVWVTNSRQNTVAVYRQSDLSLVHQFAPATVTHPRDVVIDQVGNKAYVSTSFDPDLIVFSTQSPEVTGRVTIQSQVPGGKFGTASIAFDPAGRRLFVVSLSTNEVAVVNTATYQVDHVFPVPGARGTVGVAYDSQTNRIFVAAQGSDNLVVLNAADGAVVATTPIGAGALNVTFDPVSRRAYVANRASDTVAVVDQDGQIVANLGPYSFPNHISTDGRGNVFVVNKARGTEDPTGDRITRIQPRR